MEKGRILEIACFDHSSALLAQAAGADRIELCSNYFSGGISPSEALVKSVTEQVSIPVFIMIRPRPGNFIYANEEKEKMLRSVGSLGQYAQGIVFGALTATKNIDSTFCKAVKKEAGDLPLTFHRAIDDCADQREAIEQLIDLGVNRVLTSGAEPSARDGIKVLKELQKRYSAQITIMPGGGVRSSNLAELLDTGCHEFHSSALEGSPLAVSLPEIKKMKEILLGRSK